MEQLMRTASIKRKTNETDVEVAVNLDGAGVSNIATGIVNAPEIGVPKPPDQSDEIDLSTAAKRTLGRWHLAGGAGIDRDRRPQRPRQTLKAGFGDMVAVLAI